MSLKNRSWPDWSAEYAQEPSRLVVETGEHRFQVIVSQVAGHALADHLTKIGGQGQVAALVELGGIESRPASVDSAALHRATQHEHYVSVSVVGAAIAVFARRAAKL